MVPPEAAVVEVVASVVADPPFDFLAFPIF